MKYFGRLIRWLSYLLASIVVLWGVAAPPCSGASFGRLSGTVIDPQGNPLMGAIVLVTGPVTNTQGGSALGAERVITDAHGRFAVERLSPGRYSLRVTSPTRLPILRNGILVAAGQTTEQKFVLTDIFSPLRIAKSNSKVSNWGDDWKWILRSSAATRPVLRYQEVTQGEGSGGPASKRPLPPSQRLVGMMPGSSRSEALSEDPGVGSVLAYLRPLSDDSDLLVAGSLMASGVQASSLATSFRNHMMKGDPQELTLVVHQLNFGDGPFADQVAGREGAMHAQGLVLSYSHTRKLSSSLTLTGGFEIDYLNASHDLVEARPRMKLEYRVNPTTHVAVRYGTVRLDGAGSLMDRVDTMNAFPRVTLRGFRARLEQLNHTEVSVDRVLGKNSRIELASYHDYFQDAVVRGVGGPNISAWLMGDSIPSPAADGVLLNAGNYSSSGLRAVYARRMGRRVEAAFTYALGESLVADTAQRSGDDFNRGVRGVLRPYRGQTFAGKVSTRVPVTNTYIVTAYQWLQRDRVTTVDPFGQSNLQLQPYLGIQIRQPLPALAFLPARIEALADFRNLLGQGYVPLARESGKPFLLGAAERSFRGGFSVLF